MFFSPKERTYFVALRDETIKQLEQIIDYKPERDTEIEKCQKIQNELIQPKNFIGAFSEELKYDREFEKSCIELSKHTNKDVKRMTVKEYFALINYIKNKKPNAIGK